MFLIRLVGTQTATQEFLRQTNAYKVYLQVCFMQHKLFLHKLPTLTFSWISKEEKDTATGWEFPRRLASQNFLVRLCILFLTAMIHDVCTTVQDNSALLSFLSLINYLQNLFVTMRVIKKRMIFKSWDFDLADKLEHEICTKIHRICWITWHKKIYLSRKRAALCYYCHNHFFSHPQHPPTHADIMSTMLFWV